MRILRNSLAGLTIALAVSSVCAQQAGGVVIKVLDAKDKTPLPGVQVTVTNDQKAIAPSTVITDARGEAHFPILPSRGVYAADVFSPDYQRFQYPGIKVEINQTRTIVVQLLPEQEEVVKIVAERPVVELEKTSTSTKFSDEFLADLPVQGRFYQNMLTFAPGVQDADGDGNPNVHGARDRDFKATVSGVSNQDPLTGQSLGLVNMDSIEEIEVVTAGAGAEYSRAQGGFANIIQKQGSNDFEGVASFIYRSDKLDGNGASNIPTSLLPDFKWLQPSAQVSGPIFKDRLWYRFSHELIDVGLPVDVLGGVAVQSIKQEIHDDQITWQVSPRNKLAFQYRLDPLEASNVGVSSARPPESTVRVELGGPTYTMTWTAPYSPKLLLESQAAYQNYHQNLLPASRGTKNDCVSGIGYLEDAFCFNARSGNFSGSFPQDWRDKRQRFGARNQGTFYAGRFWGMTHTLKFGLQIENERYFRSLEERPVMTFIVVDRISQPSSGGPPKLEQVGIAFTSFSIPPFSTMRATGTTWGFYATDELKPRSNLSMTLGARVDKEYINSNGFLPFDPEAESQFFIENRQNTGDPLADAGFNRVFLQQVFTAYEGLQGQGGLVEQFSTLFGFPVSLAPTAAQSTNWQRTRRPGNINLDNTNFAPRFAISWDPWSDSKTKFALTAGRYYDKIFLAIPTFELEPLRLDLAFDAKQQGGGWIVEPRSDPINPASTSYMVDRNLRTPYQDELTFSFERELPMPETSLKLTYIRRSFKDQLQDIDINHVPADYGRCTLQTDPKGAFIVESPGADPNTPLTDLFTGETYFDTDLGIGDGRRDDCTGELLVIEGAITGLGSRNALVNRPDGIADLYAQNPAWGSIFLVGNFNSAEYTGYVLELTRRQYKNWQLEGSYTLSRAVGDGEDYALQLGDDRSTLSDERGYQSYDIRHSVKVNATTQTPWGFRLGGAVRWESGLPFSLLRQDFAYNTIPPFYSSIGTPDPSVRTRYATGRRNDQRNQSYWNFDVRFAKEINLPGGKNLQLTAEIFNLLNDGTLIVWNQFLRAGRQVNGRNDSFRRFGREFQLGLRLAF